MCPWKVTILWLDCQALVDLTNHTTPKHQSRVATFTSQLIYQFKVFFDRVWFANNQLCKRYILIYFWPNLAPNWLRGMALKSWHATWLFCQDTTSKSILQQHYLFYSIILSSEVMALQIKKDIRRSKRKLSTFLDLPDSPFLS